MYKGERFVIKSEEKRKIIHDIHEGIRDSCKSKAMVSHRGRDSTYQKRAERFFGHNLLGDVSELVKRCKLCQKHRIMQNVPELQSIPVSLEVMKQIGVNICNLPVVNGHKHLAVCIDYFSKWSEAKPLKDKLVESVPLFVNEIICSYDCMRLQTNDQGREFVNDVFTELHEMTGVDQRVTSDHHPQANGLCKHQNKTIKD